MVLLVEGVLVSKITGCSLIVLKNTWLFRVDIQYLWLRSQVNENDVSILIKQKQKGQNSHEFFGDYF